MIREYEIEVCAKCGAMIESDLDAYGQEVIDVPGCPEGPVIPPGCCRGFGGEFKMIKVVPAPSTSKEDE